MLDDDARYGLAPEIPGQLISAALRHLPVAGTVATATRAADELGIDPDIALRLAALAGDQFDAPATRARPTTASPASSAWSSSVPGAAAAGDPPLSPRRSPPGTPVGTGGWAPVATSKTHRRSWVTPAPGRKVTVVGYVLHGALGSSAVLAPCRVFQHAHTVAVGQGLHLLPMTDDFFDEVRQSGVPASLHNFWTLPGGFDRLLAAWSVKGPVAYVEAEYFGGAGTQAAAVWHGGVLALGPLVETGDPRYPARPSPISQALRRLGVSPEAHLDEFEAVGLGRHRDIDGWLDEAR
jgi:hypothetical protein